VPYVTIIVPAETGIGRTVDTTIGATPARVMLVNEQILRIEPDDVCRIIAVTAEDSD
jgi:hypothetical protein